VRAKIASDPVVRAIAGLGDLGEVVDAGCGRGQLLVGLLEAAHATRGVGVDWDVAKIEIARAAAAGLPARFESGDLRVYAIASCDTVLLVDVLHYLTDAEQDALLGRAATAARHRIVVRDLDPHRGWRSGVARVHEVIVTGLGINRGARIRVRPVSAITNALEAHGFAASVAPCWGATPFANVLVVGTRTPGHASPRSTDTA
jgi:SAM-dependent methyltransferase